MMKLPKPDRMRFDELIINIRNGHILIPQFQRDFVWKLEDTGKLIDSIIKGYPIGTFILWVTRERMSSVKKLGGETFPDPHENDNVRYVLDGQQRIASLFMIHEGKTLKKNNKTKDYKEIYVNLEKSKDDEEPIVSTDEEGEYLSVHELIHGDILKLNKRFNKKEIDKIKNYRKILNRYEFSIIEISDHAIDEAVEIFTRINTTGTELTLFEIMIAKTYVDNKFDMKKKYDKFQKKLEKKGYNTLRPRRILDTLSLIIVGECSRKKILRLDKKDVMNKWDNAIKSIEFAIDYFKTHLKINASEIIPYDTLITLIAYFYYKNNYNPPDTSQIKSLNKYFWMASLSERFSGATINKIRDDSKKMEDIVNKRTVKYDFNPNFSRDDIKYMKFSTGKSFCKAILCLLAQQEPLSFKDGSKVILDNSSLRRSNSRNYHHFFPKKFLKTKGIPNRNSIINITYINQGLNVKEIRDKAPSVYIKKFKASNPKFDKTMKSHLINDPKVFGIWRDNYDRFLEKRAELIYSELQKRLS